MTEPNKDSNGSAPPEGARTQDNNWTPEMLAALRELNKRNDSAPPEVAQSTRQAAIDRMIARKLQATIDGQEEHARLVARFRTRERAQRILEAIDAR